MNKNQLLEGTKLIAYFIGMSVKKTSFKLGYNLSMNDQRVMKWSVRTEQGLWEEFMQGACFHTSWNWLMLAIDKIELLGYQYRISGLRLSSGIYYYKIQFLYDDNTDTVIVEYISNITDKENKIQAIYKAVLLFIKWYKKLLSDQNTLRELRECEDHSI